MLSKGYAFCYSDYIINIKCEEFDYQCFRTKNT